LILNFILFKWINYLQKCFITEVNISLSLQFFLPQVIYGGAHRDGFQFHDTGI
jgi:hypothetical protein